jgi:hypothetical protein
MMRFDAREMSSRGGMKRRPAPPMAPAPEPAPKYDPTILQRWRKAEKPIEIIE